LVIKVAVSIAVSIAFFAQDFAIVFNDAINSEISSYLLVIPVIFAYLIYRKRKMLKATLSLKGQTLTNETKHVPIIAGILLLTTAILFYWYGSYTFTPLEFHLFALPIFVAGLILILFNPQTLRQLIFPVTFLIFLIPPPSEILYGIGATLSIISSEASYAIVKALGVPSMLSSEYGNPTIMITRANGVTIPFSVDIACSGIYSLIGFLIFAVFIAYIMRDNLWKKLVIFIVGFPLIYFLNITRITSVLLIGYHYGEEIALEIFHLLGGWILIFLGALLLLTVSNRVFHLSIFEKPIEKCINCNSKSETDENFCITCGKILKHRFIGLSKKDIVKIVTISSSILLITSIQAPVFALTSGPAIAIINTPSGVQTSLDILPEIQGYKLNFVYRDTEFEKLVKQDMALLYYYTPIEPVNKPLTVTLEIASTRSSLHGWENCLISWPLKNEVIQKELRDIRLLENPPIIGRYLLFQYRESNQLQCVLYWFETGTFNINSTAQHKHVKISVIAYPDDLTKLTSLQNQLQVCATAVANHWQPIKFSSQAALFLSLNGDKLAMLTTVLLAIVVSFYILVRRRERRKNFTTYNKLSKSNKQIINLIVEAEKTSIPTINNISIAYQKMTRKPIDKLKLLRDLSLLEKTGIIKWVIASRSDIPIMVWKTQMNFKQVQKTT
jgi:exosortase